MFLVFALLSFATGSIVASIPVDCLLSAVFSVEGRDSQSLELVLGALIGDYLLTHLFNILLLVYELSEDKLIIINSHSLINISKILINANN